MPGSTTDSVGRDDMDRDGVDHNNVDGNAPLDGKAFLGARAKTAETEGRKQTEGKEDPSDEPAAVHLRFARVAGERLRRPEPTSCPKEGPFWTERPMLLKRADGTYELIGTSRNLQGLARWVLSFGTSAEVRCPERLQREVALQARRVWQEYEIW